MIIDECPGDRVYVRPESYLLKSIVRVVDNTLFSVYVTGVDYGASTLCTLQTQRTTHRARLQPTCEPEGEHDTIGVLQGAVATRLICFLASQHSKSS